MGGNKYGMVWVRRDGVYVVFEDVSRLNVVVNIPGGGDVQGCV